jgi:hypothetical protein
MELDTTTIMFATMPADFPHQIKVLHRVKQLCNNWDGPQQEYDMITYSFHFDTDSDAHLEASDVMYDWCVKYDDLQVEFH